MASYWQMKSGSWRIRAYDGGGKCKYETVPSSEVAGLTPAKLEKELNRRATLFEQKVKHGQAADCTMKLSDFYKFWHDKYAVPNLAPKTLYTYDILWKRVDAQLGHIRVDKITPSRLQSFYAWLSNEAVQVPNGRKNAEAIAKGEAVPKSLSPKTVHHCHRLVSSVLSYAVKLGFVPQNPCERVIAPKKPMKEAYSLSPEQVGRMVAALEHESLQFQAMVMLYLQSGMRKSELVGLTWANYDAEHALLRVECELQYLPTQDAQGEKPKQGSLAGLQVRPPKNESSKRYVKLPASMVALLESLYSQQQAHKIDAGELWQDETPVHLRRDWIFSNELGSPRHPDSFPKMFKKFLARAGFTLEEVKLIHTHTLRHTTASLLIEANVNLTTVAKRLGHADASTTNRIYAHAIGRADAVASEVIDAALHAAPAPASA